MHLRGDDGMDPVPRTISVLEHRLHPGHRGPELETLPPEAIVSGSVWLVFATSEGSRVAK